MSILTKIKFVYNNWGKLESLILPSGINLEGYGEYRMVENLRETMYTLDREEAFVRLPEEVHDKAHRFKLRVLEGRL